MQARIRKRPSPGIITYSLGRRMQAVLERLRHCRLPESAVVVDIGMARGQLLREVISHFDVPHGIGMDISFSYLLDARPSVPCVVQGDGRRMPFRDSCLDIILAIATIKHVRGLTALLEESRRTLGPGGQIFIVDPTPLGIRIGMLQGHFRRQTIKQILSATDTERLLRECGFARTQAERFMICPFRFPGSDLLEKWVRRSFLNRFFLYQIVCGEVSRESSGRE